MFSLYTISGGIRIEGDLPAHPLTNTAFLAAGGLLASVIGTTGAAMLLIRPLLETNRERTHVQHTVVFFIFIVCNCGGCCCRWAIRRCFSAICWACRSSGPSGYGRNGCW